MRNRFLLIFFFGLFLTGGVVYYALNRKPEGQRLAEQYCAACHLFPEPDLLDKTQWRESVLPRMAFRMGLEVPITYDLKDLQLIKEFVPDQPMLSSDDFQKIRDYYLRQSPQTLVRKVKQRTEVSGQFSVERVQHIHRRPITLIDHDPESGLIALSSAFTDLVVMDSAFQTVDSTKLESPASSIQVEKDGFLLCIMGPMAPSEQSQGKLVFFDRKSRTFLTRIDSLKRPVDLVSEDLDGNGVAETIISSFGYQTGSLALYPGGNLDADKKIVLSESAGTRRVAIADWDKDGMKDIIALITQGDERLVFYRNKGNLQFEESILMRFPPVYGSSFFELADFDGDGSPDIVYCNGDNADQTKIVKYYHGIRVFRHTAAHGLDEKYFFSMPGAYQTIIQDFDLDGDLDIAAISAFPDLADAPELSFVYFDHSGNFSFGPKTIRGLSGCSWMVMECFDQDRDGDQDLVLAPFSFNQFRGVSNPLAPYLLVLRNTRH